ncbi:hypothetical protein STEG23_027123, partial [Scotinomys teguina]
VKIQSLLSMTKVQIPISAPPSAATCYAAYPTLQKMSSPINSRKKYGEHDAYIRKENSVLDQWEYAERPMWLPEHCVHPVDVPADTKDHEDDPDSTNIGTGAMDVGQIFDLQIVVSCYVGA